MLPRLRAILENLVALLWTQPEAARLEFAGILASIMLQGVAEQKREIWFRQVRYGADQQDDRKEMLN